MNIEISKVSGGFLKDRVQDRAQNHRSIDSVAGNRDRQERTEASVIVQSLIDACGSPIAILGSDQKIRFVNRAWRQFASLAGVSGQDACVGSRYPEVSLGAAASSNRDADAIAAGIRSVIDKSEIEFRTEYLCTATAEPVWFRVHAAGFSLDGYTGSAMVLVTLEDITEERQAVDLQVKDKERTNRLLDATSILPWEVDAASLVFTHIGDQAEQLLGYPKDVWFEPDFWIDHIHPDDRQRVLTESALRSQSSDRYQYEYRMIGKDGRVVWFNDIVSIRRENGFPTTISGYMVDITERKSAEKTLMLLSGRLITAQEDERKRIARELHDDLNQRMALMSIELEQMGQTLPNKSDALIGRIQELQRKAVRISQEIHRMSYKLHPSKLDHLGLIPALKSFCSELAERRQIRVNFRHEGPSAILVPDVTLCLFRVAQEALQNSAKHSGGSQVDIVLTITETAATLHVSDSGCGFDMNTGKMTEGLGFISMQERLRLVNGSLDVESRPLSGTRIRVSVPVNNVAPDRPAFTGQN